jgi:AbiV family abortive infection protein
MINEEIRPVFDRCIKNARSLLDSAKELSEHEDRLHISHHLTILALEEVGKAAIILVHSDALTDKLAWLDDHVKKIFWALWSFTLSRKSVSTAEITKLKDAARGMHESRLRTLYVDVTRDQNELVDPEQLKSLIRIAEARLTWEEIAEPADLTDEEKAVLDWFLGNAQNERVQWVMYGTESFAYLESVAGDVRAWIKWIKQKYEYLEQFNLELAEKELSRIPHQEDTDEPKWRIVVRLEAMSHTMRPKALAEWNKQKWPIVLDGESGKKDLRVEITFPKRIPLQHLWEAALSEVMAFVSALNIGSQGLFWWYAPKFTSKFYETLYDIENKAPFEMKGNPSPAPVWGRTEPLNSHDIVNIQAVYIYIRDSKRYDPTISERYFQGLALLMKSDFFYPFGWNCIQSFYLAFQAFYKQQGFWDGKTNFEDAVILRLDTAAHPQFRRVAALAENAIKSPAVAQTITGTDAAMMKMYFDSSLIRCARDFVKQRFGSHLQQNAEGNVGDEKND